MVTYIQASQTVPAEHVLAALAHHLGAALVLLDWHRARRTALDQIIVERNADVLALALGGQAASVLLARHGGMPLRTKKRVK